VGAYQAALARLRDEWGCNSLKEAQTKLEKLQKKEQALKVQLTEELADFTKKWRHLL